MSLRHAQCFALLDDRLWPFTAACVRRTAHAVSLWVRQLLRPRHTVRDVLLWCIATVCVLGTLCVTSNYDSCLCPRYTESDINLWRTVAVCVTLCPFSVAGPLEEIRQIRKQFFWQRKHFWSICGSVRCRNASCLKTCVHGVSSKTSLWSIYFHWDIKRGIDPHEPRMSRGSW